MLLLLAQQVRSGPAIDIRPLLLGAGWYLDEPGGLNRYHAGLHRALEGIGLNPTSVVIGPGEGAAPGFVVARGVLATPLPLRLFGLYRAAAGRAGSCDVVDAHFAVYAYLPVVLGKLRNRPLVVHFQGPWAEESRVNAAESRLGILLKRLLERSFYRRADELITLSAAFKRILVERYGVRPWDVSVVPPGVDLEQFVPGDRVAARKLLDLPAEAPVVLAVRRMVPRMGLDVLIRSWPAVTERTPEALLLMVGTGTERESLEELAERMGVADSVRFLGGVDEARLAACYASADLSAVPSTALEGYGLSVLESLASGVPALVSDVGGLPEAVAPLDPALVVEAGDPRALAEAISALLSGEQAPPSTRRCREYAQTFDWAGVAERHAAIYRNAVSPPPRKPRVVFVDHCAQLSGGELAMLKLLPALDKVQTHVILAEDGPLVGKLLQAGASVEVLKLNPKAATMGRDRVSPGRVPLGALFNVFRHTLRLALRLRRLRPDIVHANSLKSGFYGVAAARLAGIPAVWHVRDRIAPDYLPGFAVRLVRLWARRAATAVIANSKATAQTLVSCKDLTVVPSPVKMAPAPPRAVVPGRPLMVGMVGRLMPWKGQDVFLKAFAEAFAGDDSRAVLVGSAMFGQEDFEGSLKQLADDLGIADRVDMKGFRSDVAGEMNRMDVLVHASVIPEPFGGVVVEGMACGLAVVAAAAGGPLEIVTDEVNGLLYPPGDSHALASQLSRLAADPALRDRLGRAGVVRSADFTPSKVAAGVTAVYERVLEGQA